jgi:hypothetical protein
MRCCSAPCFLCYRVTVCVHVFVQAARWQPDSVSCCYDICHKAFYGKQKCIRRCGPCISRFHLSCLNTSDVTKLSFCCLKASPLLGLLTVSRLFAVRRTREMLPPACDLLTPRLPQKLSPERELILPSLKAPE